MIGAVLVRTIQVAPLLYLLKQIKLQEHCFIQIVEKFLKKAAALQIDASQVSSFALDPTEMTEEGSIKTGTMREIPEHQLLELKRVS